MNKWSIHLDAAPHPGAAGSIELTPANKPGTTGSDPGDPPLRYLDILLQTARVPPLDVEVVGKRKLTRTGPHSWQLDLGTKPKLWSAVELTYRSAGDPIVAVKAAQSADSLPVYDTFAHYQFVRAELTSKFTEGSKDWMGRMLFVHMDIISWIAAMPGTKNHTKIIKAMGVPADPWLGWLQNLDQARMGDLQNSLYLLAQWRGKQTSVRGHPPAQKPGPRPKLKQSTLELAYKVAALFHDIAVALYGEKQIADYCAGPVRKRKTSSLAEAAAHFASGTYYRPLTSTDKQDPAGDRGVMIFNLEPNGIMFLAFSELAQLVIDAPANDLVTPQVREYWTYMHLVFIGCNEVFFRTFAAAPSAHPPQDTQAMNTEIMKRRMADQPYQSPWSAEERSGLLAHYLQLEDTEELDQAWSIVICRGVLPYNASTHRQGTPGAPVASV